MRQIPKTKTIFSLRLKFLSVYETREKMRRWRREVMKAALRRWRRVTRMLWRLIVRCRLRGMVVVSGGGGG